MFRSVTVPVLPVPVLRNLTDSLRLSVSALLTLLAALGAVSSPVGADYTPTPIPGEQKATEGPQSPSSAVFPFRNAQELVGEDFSQKWVVCGETPVLQLKQNQLPGWVAFYESKSQRFIAAYYDGTIWHHLVTGKVNPNTLDLEEVVVKPFDYSVQPCDLLVPDIKT